MRGKRLGRRRVAPLRLIRGGTVLSTLKWLWLSALVVVLDQAAKHFAVQGLELHHALRVLPGFNLTLVHNTGAAFSFLRDAGGWQRWFFVGMAITVSVILVVWLARLAANRGRLACALCLILGGALGNLWDRINLGYVIDFIDVYAWTWHWPAFNIADSAITMGAIILIADSLWLDRAEIDMHDVGRAKVDRSRQGT